MELTNQTYLRSRVDMQLADSLRMKASNKISAGVMGNARENSGSFSAGIRFKSNQYLLQSRRANIQNSLSYLEVQRNSIMEARDIMEKIAMTKIKFDAPTLNASDRRNLNIEFMELTGQLKEMKSEKFNGVSIFTSTATGSPHLFKGSKAVMDTANNLTVSDHVLHYYDIEKIIDAGDAVSRGKGGLAVINFETDPAQKQVENITIGGSMAAGDTFSFQLNTLNAIREVMDTQAISYQYTQADETSFGTDHDSARDHVIQQLITDVQNKVGSKIVADVHPNSAYSMRLTALTEGDAFELFNVRASGSDGKGTEGSMAISEDSHEATINADMTGALAGTGNANAAESRIITLDFMENATGSGASIIANTTTVGVTIDGNPPITYTATQDDVNAINSFANGGSGDDGSTAAITDSNPDGFDVAARMMALGLAKEINDNATAAQVVTNSGTVEAIPTYSGATGSVRQVSQGVYEMTITATERGKFINLSSDTDSSIKANPTPNDPSIISGDEVTSVAPTINFGTTATNASRSWVALENADPARTFQSGDRVTITMDEPAAGTSTFNYDYGTDFTNWAGLKTAMGNDRFTVNDDPGDPDRIIIAAPINNTGEQPTLSIQQTQTNDVGSVLAVGTSDTLFNAKVSSVSARDADNATGSGGNLKVDFNIANDGIITDESVNALSAGNTDWEVGDEFTIGNNTLADDVGSQVTFRVDGVEGKLKSGLTAADFTISGTGKTAAETYTATTDLGNGLVIEVTTNSDGTIASTNLINGGSGFANAADGTIATVAASQLGGDTGVKNATAATFEITVVTGSGEVSAINWQNDGSGNTIEQYTGVATNTSGSGSGLTLDITTDKGVVTAASINSAGSGYLNDGVLTNQTVSVLAANVGGGDAGDIDFTINRDDLVGEVKAFSAQGNAKSSWSFTNANSPGGGTGLDFDGTADRSGAISLTNPSVADNGTNYTKNTPGAQAINLAVTLDGSLIANVAKNIDYTSVESAWTNRVNDDGSADIHTTDDVSSNPAYASANLAALTGDGNRGYQYIPDSDNIPAISVSDSLASAGSGNAVGEFRQVEVSVGTDSGAGEIAPGDIFTIVVQEQAHSDETSGTFAEPARAAYPAITLQYTAQAGDDATAVAQALHDLYNDTGTGSRDVAVAGGIDTKDLPTLDFQVAGTPGRVLVFSSHTQGEDFDVTASYTSDIDELDGSGLANITSNPGGLGDPNGNLSEIKNISTFRIPKSIEYFEEMLAQNEAEASRLMKAMEHLEDSMIHNEDALSKVQDTDYSQASVEHMRNAVKVQMANNVMGKSMRMNDLLIDLTTKHYRGSMLNAKA